MTPQEAYYRCKNENCRIPELESIISINSYYSYLYARDVIKGRFIEGEKLIARDLYYSYCYAVQIIKGRWEECEKTIATHPEHSYWYAHNVIKGPFHLCHSIIFNSSFKDGYIDFLKSINYDLNEISEWLI
jgi:hypothetical protein